MPLILLAPDCLDTPVKAQEKLVSAICLNTFLLGLVSFSSFLLSRNDSCCQKHLNASEPEGTSLCPQPPRCLWDRPQLHSCCRARGRKWMEQGGCLQKAIQST